MFLEGVPNLVAGWHWAGQRHYNFAVRVWPLPARRRVHRDGTAASWGMGTNLFELQNQRQWHGVPKWDLSHKRLGQVSRLLKRRRLRGFTKKVACTLPTGYCQVRTQLFVLRPVSDWTHREPEFQTVADPPVQSQQQDFRERR